MSIATWRRARAERRREKKRICTVGDCRQPGAVEVFARIPVASHGEPIREAGGHLSATQYRTVRTYVCEAHHHSQTISYGTAKILIDEPQLIVSYICNVLASVHPRSHTCEDFIPTQLMVHGKACECHCHGVPAAEAPGPRREARPPTTKEVSR